MEPQTVATLALAVRPSNHSARSHPILKYRGIFRGKWLRLSNKDLCFFVSFPVLVYILPVVL
jgi:hypothetical protein